MLSNIYALLTPQERRKGYLLLLMLLITALFDVIGVASITPFVAVLSKPELIDSNGYLRFAHTYMGSPDLKDFQIFLSLVFFICLLFSVGFKLLTTLFLVRFTYMQQYSLSKRLVTGYLYQPYVWFLNRHSADLGKTVLSEVDQVISEALMPLLNLIAQVIFVLTLLVLLVLVDPILAFAVIIFFSAIYGGIYSLLRSRIFRVGRDRVHANRMRFAILAEAFSGIKDIKVHGLESVFVSRFEGPALIFSSNKAFAQATSQLPRFVLEVLVFGGILLLVLVLTKVSGGFDEAIPIVTLYAFAGYRLMPAMQQIYASLNTLRFSRHALTNLHKEMDVLSQTCSIITTGERVELKRAITLNNISYTYPLAQAATLKKLTLNIPAHSTVGFVGPTGSGKTTSADVILGLLEPQEGQLLIDGVAITRENRSAWQRNIGYVPQVIYLSDDTVAANIAFGVAEDQIDQCAVERAARIANLHDFVSSELSLGYKTHIGERGVRLSGGQRQRIGIARALYRNPTVLILDEATSALDNLTERAVMEAVHNLSHQITIIIIAHRLSTVKACDTIFLLNKGAVAGYGTYEQLQVSNEYFGRLTNTSLI